MARLDLFYLTNCPYCKNARKAVDALMEEEPAFRSLDLHWIEESLEPELAQTRELLTERENSLARLRSLNASASSITEVLNRSVESFVDEYRRLTKAANKDCGLIKIEKPTYEEIHDAV